MNCAECKELLVEYTEGLLEDSRHQAVLSHLRDCPTCQNEQTELSGLRDRLVANGRTVAKNDLEDEVLNRIIREQSIRLRKAHRQFQVLGTIIKSRVTRLAVAAAVVVAVGLGIIFLEKSATPAYAIDQTIEACHSVRFLHSKIFNAGQDEPKEFWMEFDEYGNVKNVRAYFPAWNSPREGAKVIVWKENKAYVWSMDRNLFATAWDETVAADMLRIARETDPRLAVERLYEQKSQGKVKIDIDEPSDKSKPIVVTATYLPESSSPNRRSVLLIDRATKLVMVVEGYKLINGEYQLVETLEHYDYNQPISAEMFSLDEVPPDAMKIDQTTKEVGLPKGNLTDQQIAVELVRQYIQALIDVDYAKAGKLYMGLSADLMQQYIQDVKDFRKVLRLVSVGQPTPVTNVAGTPVPAGWLKVPCVIEVEKDAGVSQWQPDGVYVAPVHGQPSRWGIRLFDEPDVDLIFPPQ